MVLENLRLCVRACTVFVRMRVLTGSAIFLNFFLERQMK